MTIVERLVTIQGALPDLFRLRSGALVDTPEAWGRRRGELRALLHETVYGPLPPAPRAVRGELLHREHPVPRFGGAYHFIYRIHIESGARPFWFHLDLLVPPIARSDGGAPLDALEMIVPDTAGGRPQPWPRLPVVLTSDGCWSFVTDEVANEVLRRGYILARFNRTEIVPDNHAMPEPRDTSLYLVYPETPFRCLGAWAWGFHRVMDFLPSLNYADPKRVAAVGHSRGGKSALLAAATDERIALAAPNNSGNGGAGCFRWQGPGCETIRDSVTMVPHWYAPRFAEFAEREQDLPVDLHALKALVAPRALVSTEALDDAGANPLGTWHTHLAAREVYRFLGVPERIGICFRPGGHDHGLADWRAFLDFADWQMLGAAAARRFNLSPDPFCPDPTLHANPPSRKSP